jgi:flagellar biogenesis protein FliO
MDFLNNSTNDKNKIIYIFDYTSLFFFIFIIIIGKHCLIKICKNRERPREDTIILNNSSNIDLSYNTDINVIEKIESNDELPSYSEVYPEYTVRYQK